MADQEQEQLEVAEGDQEQPPEVNDDRRVRARHDLDVRPWNHGFRPWDRRVPPVASVVSTGDQSPVTNHSPVTDDFDEPQDVQEEQVPRVLELDARLVQLLTDGLLWEDFADVLTEALFAVHHESETAEWTSQVLSYDLGARLYFSLSRVDGRAGRYTLECEQSILGA